MNYAKNIGIALEGVLEALDKLCNAFGGGNGRMTISARMGFAIRDGRCVLCKGVCGCLGLIWKNHCSNAADNFTKQATK